MGILIEEEQGSIVSMHRKTPDLDRSAVTLVGLCERCSRAKRTVGVETRGEWFATFNNQTLNDNNMVSGDRL
jgi:hypothetical protein